MTELEFDKAFDHLQQIFDAVQTRDMYACSALILYSIEEYELAMSFNFSFLEWQDNVESLNFKTFDHKTDRLWRFIGGYL